MNDAATHDASDRMVVIAHLVSRVEAIVLVSTLEAAGIFARADGIHHASVEVNSLALMGHRIWIPALQVGEASALIREIGANEDWQFSHGLRMAVLRVLGIWLTLTAPIYLLGAITGAFSPLESLISWPLQALSLPVNPQGRGQFYLVPATS